MSRFPFPFSSRECFNSSLSLSLSLCLSVCLWIRRILYTDVANFPLYGQRNRSADARHNLSLSLSRNIHDYRIIYDTYHTWCYRLTLEAQSLVREGFFFFFVVILNESLDMYHLHIGLLVVVVASFLLGFVKALFCSFSSWTSAYTHTHTHIIHLCFHHHHSRL